MTAKHIIQEDFIYDGEIAKPDFAELTYKNSNCGFVGLIKIAGSASDQHIDLSKVGTTIKGLEFRISTADAGKVTLKAGSTSAATEKLNGLCIFSENTTSFYASNSNSNPVYVEVVALDE